MPAKGHDLKPEPTTQKELAARLRCSVQSLASWGKLPGAPTDYSLEAWKSFVEANQLGVGGNKVGGGREELLQEKLRGEIRLNQLKIEREEGKTILVDEVDERDLHLASMQKAYLYAVLGRELGARGAGKSAEELCVLGQQIADQVCAIFNQGVEQWRESLSA